LRRAPHGIFGGQLLFFFVHLVEQLQLGQAAHFDGLAVTHLKALAARVDAGARGQVGKIGHRGHLDPCPQGAGSGDGGQAVGAQVHLQVAHGLKKHRLVLLQTAQGLKVR
jgi:hypothetical protein